MFRASSAHLQEVNDVNCTSIQPLILLILHVLLNQMATLFLYDFILIFLYWNICFACLAMQILRFGWPCIVI